MIPEPLRLIQRQNLDSLPPEAFLRISEYFDFAVEGDGLEAESQMVNVSDEEKVIKDLELLEQMLSKYKPVFLDLSDPKK